MGRHIDAIETWLAHRARKFHRTIFQSNGFLHVLIHLRACGEVDAHVIDERTRLQHIDGERGLFACLVGPVLMIWLHQHLNL